MILPCTFRRSTAGWRRIFGRLQVEPQWALLAYEPRGEVGERSAWLAQTVEVFDRGHGGPTAIPHPAGDLVITPIADDVRLPGLRCVRRQPRSANTWRHSAAAVPAAAALHTAHRRRQPRPHHQGPRRRSRVAVPSRRDRAVGCRATWRARLPYRRASSMGSQHVSVSQSIVPGRPAAASLLAAGGDADCATDGRGVGHARSITRCGRLPR